MLSNVKKIAIIDSQHKVASREKAVSNKFRKSIDYFPGFHCPEVANELKKDTDLRVTKWFVLKLLKGGSNIVKFQTMVNRFCTQIN